jgi:hypothetical protein
VVRLKQRAQIERRLGAVRHLSDGAVSGAINGPTPDARRVSARGALEAARTWWANNHQARPADWTSLPVVAPAGVVTTRFAIECI